MSARWRIRVPLSGVLTGLMFLLTPFFGGRVSWGQEVTGPTLLENRCSGCHAPSEEGGKLASIESERKTPEGWEMTLHRMMRTHGASLNAEEARVLVKYLSDHYGLAPKEVEPFRYALEKRPNIFETFPSEAVQATCAQCHSYARIALQRRTKEMWEILPDLTAGLLPNIENQTASGFPALDDLWYTVVKRETVPYFIKTYPFDSAAWREWQKKAKPKLEGTWKVVGHDMGKGGDYTGQMVIHSVGEDRYEGTFAHEFSDGAKVSGKTVAIVYTGFQWRGMAKLEDSNGKIRLCLMDTQRSLLFLIRQIREHPGEVDTCRDVLRDLDTLMSHTTYLFDKVNFLMDAAQGFINIEQNRIIKIFSIVAVVLLPPTLVASIYGMNFRFMPELDWLLGYPMALGLMVLAALAPYWYFKRKGWL